MIKERLLGKIQFRKVFKKQIHEPWLFSLPAVILMVLIPIVFVIPNVFGHNVILPALRSVSGVGSKVDTVAPHISQWHGVNLPLILSVIVIIVGTLLALTVNWKSITHKVIKQASITNAYRKVYREFESYSGIGIRSLMSSA